MKNITTYGLLVAGLATAGLLAVAPNFAGAQATDLTQYRQGNGGGYGYQQMIETKAELLNMSVDELKAQLETKTMLEVAEENGVNEEQLREAMQTAAEARWAERGLTEEEIAERTQAREDRQQSGDCDGTGIGGGMQRRGMNR